MLPRILALRVADGLAPVRGRAPPGRTIPSIARCSTGTTARCTPASCCSGSTKAGTSPASSSHRPFSRAARALRGVAARWRAALRRGRRRRGGRSGEDGADRPLWPRRPRRAGGATGLLRGERGRAGSLPRARRSRPCWSPPRAERSPTCSAMAWARPPRRRPVADLRMPRAARAGAWATGQRPPARARRGNREPDNSLGRQPPQCNAAFYACECRNRAAARGERAPVRELNAGPLVPQAPLAFSVLMS